MARTLLGGSRYWRRDLASRSDVHAALVGGVPCGALLHLMDGMVAISADDVARVLGVSTRTLQRQRDAPDRPMPPDLASRAWLLAETLARATSVFGGREQAERWMSQPATGLDRQRPFNHSRRAATRAGSPAPRTAHPPIRVSGRHRRLRLQGLGARSA